MFGTLKIGKEVVKILPRLGTLGEEYVLKKKIRKFHFYVFIRLDTILDTQEEVPRQLHISSWSSDFRVISI